MGSDALGEVARSLHGITWRDELAWMECMKGKRWEDFIREKQTQWDSKVDKVSESIPLFMAELDAAKKTAAAPLFQSAGGLIDISVGGTVSLSWRWRGDSEVHMASDIYARRGGFCWAIEEVGDGAEVYAVRLYKKGRQTPVWEHRGVAPSVAVIGDRCYCLLAKNRLVYHKVVSWQAYTGKDEKIHYIEQDYRYNLELLRGSDTHAHIRRQAGGKQDAFLIKLEGKLVVLDTPTLESKRFIFGSRAGEALIWEKEKGWRPSNALRSRGWSFPSFQKAVPEALDTERGFLITRWQGCRTLWKIKKGSPAFTLWRNYGQILIDPWYDTASGSKGPWVRFTQPGVEPVWWNSAGDERPHTAFAWGRESFCKFVKSADGTIIPFLLTLPSADISCKGLLVVGYGAYGLSTPMSTSRWEPLLKRGWAVAIGLWRGGGDHTPEWEDAGRVYGRVKVLEDAEAVVRAAQKLTGCSAKKTVLYGRSAGGLWVGGLVAKHPKGDLAAGAYMEVPYLDVLRTITNRTLPLTEIETDEFGLPEQRLSDLAAALEWSPMELLPEGGVKGVWQIVRTGLNDSEVLAYESAKWVARSGKSAYLAVEGGQGHFVSGAVGLRQQAADLAVLLELASG
jgi:hypothetical protein